MVAALPPGKRESVREIVLDAARRAYLTTSGRLFLDAATGAPRLAEILAQAIAEAPGEATAKLEAGTFPLRVRRVNGS